MNSILNEINYLWQIDFKDIYKGKKRGRKILGPETTQILVVFNERNFEKVHYKPCPFDNPENKTIYRKYKSLWYGINSKPVEEKHVILFPSEHREWPTEKDYDDVLNFTSEVPYICSLNLNGSGASIENHVHFQSLREYFPCFDDQKIVMIKDDGIVIYELLIPYYGILIYANSSKGRKKALRIANLRKPYNLILKSKQNEDYIFVYPRDGIYLDFLGTFKIGGPEMGRLFYAKNYEQYKKWDYTNLLKALQEVSLKKEEEKNIFRKEISDLVREKNIITIP